MVVVGVVVVVVVVGGEPVKSTQGLTYSQHSLYSGRLSADISTSKGSRQCKGKTGQVRSGGCTALFFLPSLVVVGSSVVVSSSFIPHLCGRFCKSSIS